MNQEYKVTGMTCGGCEASVRRYLQNVAGVEVESVSRESEEVVLSMNRPVPISELSNALAAANGKYSITQSKKENSELNQTILSIDDDRSWLATYKPILIIFGYIAGATFLIQLSFDSMDYTIWMRHFMAGFFLVFSFFKLLNLRGFADSYAMYDVIARKLPVWGYLYAFIELGLGVSYLTNCCPFITNVVALVVMSVSIIGVLQSVLNKETIQCACLGDVFNLPMSTVTIIEDGLMILMSGFMLSQSL